MLPAALANATEEDVDFRESLPNDYLDYTGIAFQTEPSEVGDRMVTKRLTTEPPSQIYLVLAPMNAHNDGLSPHAASAAPIHLVLGVVHLCQKMIRYGQLRSHTCYRFICQLDFVVQQ